MSENGIRAYIKPETIQRYSKYAEVKLGQSADDFFNTALTNIENINAEKLQAKVKEVRKK